MRQRIFTLFFALAAVGLPLQAQPLTLTSANYNTYLEPYQGRIMAIENSFGADTPFAKETDLGNNWDSDWGFGPEDFKFKNVWEEME